MRRSIGFLLLPFIGALAPFIFLPLIAHRATTEAWAAVGIGLSVGSLAAMVLAGGWTLGGPSMVANMENAVAYSVLSRSLQQKLLLVVPVAGLAGAFAAAIGRSEPVLAFSVASSNCLVGLRSDWFFIGRREIRPVAIFETAPRIGSLVLGAVAYGVTGLTAIFPAALLVGSAVATSLMLKYMHSNREHFTPVTNVPSLPHPGASLVAEVSGTLYSVGAVALVGVAASLQSVAEFTSGDRIYKLSLLSIIALSQTLQGWVFRGDSISLPGRAGTAMRLHTVLGIWGAFAIALTASSLSSFVFGARNAIGLATSAGFGVSFLFVSISTALARIYLAPRKRIQDILAGTVLGAVVGVPCIVILSYKFGAAGGGVGLAVSQGTVVLVQGMAVWRCIRKR